MPTKQVKNIDTRKYVFIKGAKMHNLKNVDVTIPKNKITVLTGLSGSGKSSLAFDTLFAEGQRRYVESLSSYARQFLGKLEKPNVDHIYGIAPAIAIEQKVNISNKRSTVGTSTEIYDYLKLLYSRIGKTFSPISNKEVKRDSTSDIVEQINLYPENTKAIIISPIVTNTPAKEVLELLLKQGFSRVLINNKIYKIDEAILIDDIDEVFLVIDRIIVKPEDEENNNRVADSIETAFFEGEGYCSVVIDNEKLNFSNKFELDGISFTEPTTHFFSFNNPLGACKNCDGFGSVIGIDEYLVIPNKNLSIYDNAIMCWRGEKMQKWKNELIFSANKFDFPIHKPYYELTSKQKDLLWTGNKHFKGLNDFFKMIESKSHKIQYRVMLSRYRGKTTCPECKGTRLRKDASYVKISNHSIIDLVLKPINELQKFFNQLELNQHDKTIARRLLIEINNRLSFLVDVGLGYLTLNRLSSSLSGGESQRINLATSLGSSLVGSIYILDEPSIGLHSKDTERLIDVLKKLRDLGNTVVVVEHDEDIIKAADNIIDIGPKAGTNGGNVVFNGTYNELLKSDSITAKYLNNLKQINTPSLRRKWNNSIVIEGARENNLKNITVKFPLNILTVVTGVSGSGKSSLVKNCLVPAIKKQFEGYAEQTGNFDKISGSINQLHSVEYINQNPIGKSSRSNPVTYVKAYDDIRNLYANQKLSKLRGYKPAHFSFNVDGGRCENCKGEGEVTVEMQFMADIHLVCDHCKGKRFKEEIIEVTYNDKSIADILDLTIDDAISFFSIKPDKLATKITEKLLPLQEVGLGYVKLGQSSNTLSGGEAQRVKLASFLSKKDTDKNVLFIFDEPTTGLHFHDINKLMKAFYALIKQGHSVIVIEHNLDVIKCADWVVDLGPDSGINGGNVVFEGTPEDLIKVGNSYTGKYLKSKL